MSRWLSAIALSAAVSAQAAPPTRVEIDYDVLHNGSAMATVSHVLEHDGRTYYLSERWNGNGLLALLGEVRRTSRGNITAAGLRPLEYTDQRPRRDTAIARFSWDEGSLMQQFRDGPRTQPLPPHAQDRLSFVFAAAFGSPGNLPLEHNVADGKGVAHYVFEVAGRVRLSLPAGEFDALHLVKRGEGERSTQLWLDANRSHLPLRVLVIGKDGSRVDQVAKRIDPSR